MESNRIVLGMRIDIYQKEVLQKCDALRKAGLWPSEQFLRPTAWLNNFEEQDRGIAAFLLDKFTFYSQRYTDALLTSSYNSLNSFLNPCSQEEANKLISDAKFTLITGETPNPTDSGFLICRRLRQLFNIRESNIVSPEQALSHAISGGMVIFVDDFIGSGDQFLRTWKRNYSSNYPCSFFDIASQRDFHSIYLTIIALDSGLENIRNEAPSVNVAACHVLDEKSTVHGIVSNLFTTSEINNFLEKYVDRLTPREHYIERHREFKKFGYHSKGLMLGFEHSVPDASLPIFWSIGTDGWVPLFERA
jgi:hypothetical protein